MYRGASRLPRRATLAAAAGVVLTDNGKLSIYSEQTPDILLVRTSSPLERQIGAARRQVQNSYSDTRAYVQGWVSKWIGIEHAVEHRVKSIISPNESLTPGLLYVGVATLTGSILSRNRFLLTRFLLPPIFLIVSANHFLPQTSGNLSQYLGSLEEAYLPSVSEKHEIAKAHSHMAWARLKEATADAREMAYQTAVKSVDKIQGATGLKIKETLGWSERAAKEVEHKVVDAVHAAEKKVEEIVHPVVAKKVVVEEAQAAPSPGPVAEKRPEEPKHLV